MKRDSFALSVVLASALLLWGVWGATMLGVAEEAALAQASELTWASYLGGSAVDNCADIAVDSTGNAWLTGDTSSADFPVVDGFQTTYHEGESYPFDAYDAFVAEITPDGTLAFATYLGGVASDHGSAIAVDSTGNAWVVGRTFSTEFPTLNGFDITPRPRLSDAFVVRISPSGELTWGSRFGGSLTEWCQGIAVDSTGNVVVVGHTSSRDLPTPGGFQTSYGGDYYNDVGDGFVAKITPATTLAWASYLGGNREDWAQEVALDPAGNIWVTGFTTSDNFPVPGGFQTSYNDGIEESPPDGFVVRITPAGALAWGSYLGGSNSDYPNAVAADSSGYAWVAGYTYSPDFPTPGGFQTTFGGGSEYPYDAFVARVSPSGTLAWASYLGGSGDDSAIGIALDASGDAWLVGDTTSSDFPAPAGSAAKPTSDEDAFIVKISPSGSLDQTGYIGSSVACSASFDSTGDLWIGGRTDASDLATPEAFQTAYAGGGDAFVAKLGADVMCLSPGIGGTVAVSTPPVFTFAVTAPLVPAYIVFSSSSAFPAAPVARVDGQTDRTLRFALATNAAQWQPTAAQWKAIKRIVCLGDKLYWKVEATAQTNTVASAPRSLQFDGTAITELAVNASHLLDGKTAVWPDKKSRPSFSWTNPIGALKYFYVDVSTDSDVPLGNRAVTVSLNAGRARGLYRAKPADWMKIRRLAAKSGGVLYWQVRALDAARALKCSSDVQQLVVDAGEWTSVGTLDLSLTKPSLSWTHAGEGVVRYAIQFSTNADFSGAAATKASIPAAPPSATTRSLGPGEVLRLKALCKRNGNPAALYYRVCGWDADKAFMTYSPVQTADAP